MLNTTGENVEVITPLVTIEELRASDWENIYTLQKTGKRKRYTNTIAPQAYTKTDKNRTSK